MNKFLIPAAVVVIIAIAVVMFSLSSSNEENVQNTPNPTTSAIQESQITPTSSSEYNDGTYTDVGNYVSPGGPREINVTVTLTDGVITDAVFEGLATDPTSMRFQGEFGDNFEPQVVGKNIDEVNLMKVAGSSLTPGGFNDALEKIKDQAQS